VDYKSTYLPIYIYIYIYIIYSCVTCVVVRVEERPFFVDYNPADAVTAKGAQPDGTAYQVSIYIYIYIYIYNDSSL
jgi:hypothetical protein